MTSRMQWANVGKTKLLNLGSVHREAAQTNDLWRETFANPGPPIALMVSEHPRLCYFAAIGDATTVQYLLDQAFLISKGLRITECVGTG